jgi:hypothetical protein
MEYNISLFAAAVAAMAITTAPTASAAPSQQPCFDGGGSTQCQSTGNVEIYTAPRAMPAPTNSTYGPYLGYRGGRN